MNDLIDWNKLAKRPDGVKQSANDVTQPHHLGLLRLPPFSEVIAFISINNEEIATQNIIPYDENNVPKN